MARFAYELIAQDDFKQGDMIKFYAKPFRDEPHYIRPYKRGLLEERMAYIGFIGEDIIKGQKCYATFDSDCQVWPVKESENAETL